ncbi:MAG: hemerythrin domain-containing protein [Thermoproteota archaeon]
MMSTESLRRDHDLIEKVLKAMDVTLQLLKNGKKIPESILLPTLDFAKNFVDICHHGKEEDSLFPELGRRGMPTHMGPIATMLMEHKQTREIADRMAISAREYLQNDSADKLILDITQYIEHMAKHLWKENNRLFVMAEMRLKGYSEQMNKSLDEVERQKLEQIGKRRADYEKLVVDLEQNISNLN